MLRVELGERADAVGTQELVLVEHLGEDPAEPLRGDHSHDPPVRHAVMTRARGVHRRRQFRHPAQPFSDGMHHGRRAVPLP
jgi:hypothetical protein